MCSGTFSWLTGFHVVQLCLWNVPATKLPDRISEPSRSNIYDCCIARKYNSIEWEKARYPSK